MELYYLAAKMGQVYLILASCLFRSTAIKRLPPIFIPLLFTSISIIHKNCLCFIFFFSHKQYHSINSLNYHHHDAFQDLAAAAAVGGAVAQRPTNMSICDYYTAALLKNNTAKNQKTLLTLVVNTAVIGNCKPSLTSAKLAYRSKTPCQTLASRSQVSSPREPTTELKSIFSHTSLVALPQPTLVAPPDVLSTSLTVVELLLS